MSLTIAESSVDQMQLALPAVLRALDRWEAVERELTEARMALYLAAEAIYDGTLRDPEGRLDDAC